MHCPVCENTRMREVEKDGVMIDICPDCKGVWLDRGELEKLMKEVREVRDDFNDWYDNRGNRDPKYDKDQRYDRDRGQHNDRPDSYGYGKSGHHSSYPRKKKKNVLDMFGDLFD